MTRIELMRDAIARGKKTPAPPAPESRPATERDTTTPPVRVPTPTPAPAPSPALPGSDVPTLMPEPTAPPKPKKQAWRKGPSKSPEFYDNAMAVRGRLPDGSRFEVEYDAAAKQWSGTLTVTNGGGHQVFEATATGVFGLLHALDVRYRTWRSEARRTAAG